MRLSCCTFAEDTLKRVKNGNVEPKRREINLNVSTLHFAEVGFKLSSNGLIWKDEGIVFFLR